MLERDAKTAQRLSSGSGSRGDVCFCVSIQRLLKVWQRAHSGHGKPALHVPLWPGLPVETAVADSRPSPSRASESASSAAGNAARVDLGLPRCADGQATLPRVSGCVPSPRSVPAASRLLLPLARPGASCALRLHEGPLLARGCFIKSSCQILFPSVACSLASPRQLLALTVSPGVWS